MRNWLILCLVGSSLTGCATAPDENVWIGIDVPADPAVRPDPLPDRPIPLIRDGGLLFTGDQIRALEEYFILAESAEDIAHANADQIDELRKAAAALVDAGEAQFKVAAIRRQIIEEERRQHTFEKVGLYGIILAVIGVAAL